MNGIRVARGTVVLIAVAVLGAACGGDGQTTGPPPAGTTRVVMRDNVFDPTTLTIASGAPLQMVNQGASIHDLKIEGTDFDVDVNAGETETETVEVPPGTYQMVCTFHIPEGMTGTITVTE
ncbi:MAG: cupredoxin domain-containing protein [Actinomycetota bacterium]